MRSGAIDCHPTPQTRRRRTGPKPKRNGGIETLFSARWTLCSNRMMDPWTHRGTPSGPSHPHPREHKSNNNNRNHEQNDQQMRRAEEDPEPSKLHQPTPRYPRPAVSAASAGDAPDVYWDDRESRDPDADLAQYTFYREGTPTPPEHDSRDRGFGHGRLAAPVAGNPAAGGAGFGGDHAFGAHRPGETSVGDKKGMAPATRKKIIRAVIILGVLLVIGVAVGVGAGLGVGRSKKSEEQVEGNARSVNASFTLQISHA